MSRAPDFVRRGSRAGAKGRGIRYEERTQSVLDRLYAERYVPGPWIHFSADDTSPRWCQPDGLLFDIDRGEIVIVEIKYNHTAIAYWKLFNLYQPVVSAIFGTQWTYICAEVVKWYDRAVYGPRDVTLRPRIDLARPKEWAVVIVNER